MSNTLTALNSSKSIINRIEKMLSNLDRSDISVYIQTVGYTDNMLMPELKEDVELWLKERLELERKRYRLLVNKLAKEINE